MRSMHSPPALVVEDDPDIRAVLCELLADAGYTPTMEATDGRKALTVLRRSLQPLVVLLDLGLPRLGGAELLRRMAGVDRWRQRPRRPQQHAFVLVTAGYETARPQLASLVDAWQIPVVRKPFDLDELLAVVAQAASRLRPAIQRRGRNGD